MARPDEVYREFIRRSHRLLATYLSIYAWTKNLECLAIDREEITKFWGVQRRVEHERLEWLKADVAPYFPQVKVLSFTKGSKAFASIYLARHIFNGGAFDASMGDKERVKLLTAKGMKSAEVSVPSEAEILNVLTSTIHGLIAFPGSSGPEK